MEHDLLSIEHFLTQLGVPCTTFGNGTLRCRCPVHEERTPSFHVYPDGHAHCFGGCPPGRNHFRDIVDLVRALYYPRDKTLSRAFAWARKQGYVGASVTRPPTMVLDRSLSPLQQKALTLAAKWWHQQLSGSVGYRYMTQERGVSGPCLGLALRHVGWVPGDLWDLLRLTERQLGAGGRTALRDLSILGRTGTNRLHDRLVFVSVHGGKPVHYQTRNLASGEYRQIFNPSGFAKAPFIPLPAHLSRVPGTRLVEGPTDALAFAAQGHFSVALLGSAIPPAEELLHYPQPLISYLDNEPEGRAGSRAREGLLRICLAAGIAVCEGRIPPGIKDPAEWIKQCGAQALQEAA